MRSTKSGDVHQKEVASTLNSFERCRSKKDDTVTLQKHLQIAEEALGTTGRRHLVASIS